VGRTIGRSRLHDGTLETRANRAECGPTKARTRARWLVRVMYTREAGSASVAKLYHGPLRSQVNRMGSTSLASLERVRQRSRCAAGESAKLPSHIAIIMDGNGRWAAQPTCPGCEATRRASRRSARRSSRRRGSHRCPDAVRLSARTGSGAQLRGADAHAAAEAVPETRTQHAPHERHRFQVIGRVKGFRGTSSRSSPARATPRRHVKHALQHRAELQRPREIVDAARRAIEMARSRRPRRAAVR